VCVWLIHGIVCLTGLLLLTPMTNFGISKILYIVSEHSCRELEVVAESCAKNLSKSVYYKVISKFMHGSFGLHSQTLYTSSSN